MATPPWAKENAYITTPGALVADALTMSLEKVRVHARRMEQAIEQEDMRQTLKAASDMLFELSSSINPKNYSSLYADVFTQLQQLPYFFQDYVAQGRDTFPSLYAVTQHAGHVLPRLYLMIVCACCAMRADKSTVPFYLNDLLGFAKGIQHPIRGLFLRSFLGSSVRPILPDASDGMHPSPSSGTVNSLAAEAIDTDIPSSIGGKALCEAYASEEPADGDGNVADRESPGVPVAPVAAPEAEDIGGLDVAVSMKFLLRNFCEMNKLWTRMQRNLPHSDQRDLIRTQLAELVGKNLSQLAELQGLSAARYANVVLPCVTEQIVQCGDQLAQTFLMEAVIISFPDTFHLCTLEPLLAMCLALQPGVEVHRLMARLMDRISEHAAASRTRLRGLQGDSAFHTFLAAAKDCGLKQRSIPARGVVQVFVALANFVAAAYGADDGMLNEVLGGCRVALSGRAVDAAAEHELLELLSSVLQDFRIQRVLVLSNFAVLTEALQPRTRRKVASDVVKNLRASCTTISGAKEMRAVAAFVEPLVDADQSGADVDEEERAECVVALAAVARAIDVSTMEAAGATAAAFCASFARLRSPAPLETAARGYLAALERHAEGMSPAAAAAARRFLHEELIVPLEEQEPAAALRLLLLAAHAAATAAAAGGAAPAPARADPPEAVLFLECALAVYERSCALPPRAVDGLAAMVQCVSRLRGLPAAAHEDVLKRLLRYASSLPVREEQVDMLLACANMVWQDTRTGDVSGVQDAGAVAETFESAASAAARAERLYRGEAWGHPAHLYLSILDAAKQFKARGCDLSGLLARCEEAVARLAAEGARVAGRDEPRECWSEELQRRLDEIRACPDEPLEV